MVTRTGLPPQGNGEATDARPPRRMGAVLLYEADGDGFKEGGAFDHRRPGVLVPGRMCPEVTTLEVRICFPDLGSRDPLVSLFVRGGCPYL